MLSAKIFMSVFLERDRMTGAALSDWRRMDRTFDSLWSGLDICGHTANAPNKSIRMVGTIIAGVGITATGLTGYGVLNRKSTLLAASIWRGPQDKPAIALTFDDGPSESTADILAVLQRWRIAATFFQCGANVRRLPQVARDVCAAGHEVGNHTDTHPRLCFKSPGFITRELTRAQETIEQVTVMRPTLFRAPFGLRWYGLRSAQNHLGLTGVMWTAIGYDWSQPAARVVQILSDQATNGAIFCLHDGRRTWPNPDISATVKALEVLIPMLLDRGFYFESLKSMISRRDSARKLGRRRQAGKPHSPTPK